MVGFQRVTREVEAQNVLFFFHSSPFAPRRNFLNRHFVGRLFSEEAELVGCLFIFLSRLHDNVSIFKPLTAIRLNGIKDTGHRKDLNNLLRDELRAHPFDEIKGILERTFLSLSALMASAGAEPTPFKAPKPIRISIVLGLV